VRPGGLLAIKEFDMTNHHFYPPGPRLMWRGIEAIIRNGDAYFGQILRNHALHDLVRKAGFAEIRQLQARIKELELLMERAESYAEDVKHSTTDREEIGQHIVNILRQRIRVMK